MASAPHRGWFSRQQQGPVLYGAGLFLLLLAIWQGVVAPRLPSRAQRVGTRIRDALWVEAGIEPFTTEGDLAQARTIFAGDSRVWSDSCLEVFDEAGLGPTALIWGGGAKVHDLLAAVSKFEPQRVVLGLSSLGLKDSEKDVGQVISRVEFPDWREVDFESRFASWRAKRVGDLQAAGHEPKEYEHPLNMLKSYLDDARLVNSFTPRGIDARLARWADDARQRRIYTLQTDSWRFAWFEPLNPRKHDGIYRNRLKGVPQSEFEANLQMALKRIRALLDRGVEVVCVRMPVDAQLLKIENRFVSPELFTSFCEAAGVIYLDHSADEGLETRDGSHLTLPSANRFSRELAVELHDAFRK